MSIYLIPIKYALIIFPILAALITIPYILRQYYKYGSIHKLRSLIVYSFVLYMLTAFFLVIMPLPSKESVASMNMSNYQLELFASVKSLYQAFDWQNFSLLTLLKNPLFYTIAYNVLLTIPFGIYLRYYYKCNFWKTILFTFILSLFYEITQLTGLYFIYPDNYRLFDVDDLFFNTLGGVIGYIIAAPFMKFLPSRDKIDEDSYTMGQEISFLRRTMAFVIDAFIYLIILSVVIISDYLKSNIIFNYLEIYHIVPIFTSLYYLLLPIIFKGNTLGKRLVSIKIVTFKSPKYLRLKVFFRNLILYFIILPFLLYLYLINKYFAIGEYLYLSLVIITIICYILTFIKMLLKERAIHEIISDTVNKSIVVPNLQNEPSYDKISDEKGEVAWN